MVWPTGSECHKWMHFLWGTQTPLSGTFTVPKALYSGLSFTHSRAPSYINGWQLPATIGAICGSVPCSRTRQTRAERDLNRKHFSNWTICWVQFGRDTIITFHRSFIIPYSSSKSVQRLKWWLNVEPLKRFVSRTESRGSGTVVLYWPHHVQVFFR